MSPRGDFSGGGDTVIVLATVLSELMHSTEKERSRPCFQLSSEHIIQWRGELMELSVQTSTWRHSCTRPTDRHVCENHDAIKSR